MTGLMSQFQMIGYDLFIRGLVSSHSDNMNIKIGEQMVITRRGSMLDHLRERDLVETGIDRNDQATATRFHKAGDPSRYLSSDACLSL